MKKLIITFFLFLIFPLTASAAEGDVNVKLIDKNGKTTSSFYPFSEEYQGTGSVSTNDMGSDGIAEIIVGSGEGLSPEVKIYDKQGNFINGFLAYQENYMGGINLTTCDINNDGMNEVITGTNITGGPHVRIFNALGTPLYNNGFFAYSTDFRGGVNVACGDTDGDGILEVITGSGLTGGPHIKVFSPNGDLKNEFFSGDANKNTGVQIILMDYDQDGIDEIVTTTQGLEEAYITVFKYVNNSYKIIDIINPFPNYTNGVTLSTADINNDGFKEIVVSSNNAQDDLLKFISINNKDIKISQQYNQDNKNLKIIDLKDKKSNLHIAYYSRIQNYNQAGKYIKVDLSEQKLYAYENGILIKSFLVSTGVKSHPTPVSTNKITDKLLWHDYVWYYGPGNPNNYNIPNVKYNLRFQKHLYIHYAYWHNNFGIPMSHGCINVNLENAEWIYNWSEVGTPVEIVK